MLTRFLIVGLLVWRAAIAAVPTPESHFGHPIGVDRKLLDWSKVVSYFDALAKNSDRIKVEELGKSTEGRPFIAAWISSPENIKNLDHYRDIQAKLADPRKVTRDQAQKLIGEGKTVVMITCSIHSTEVASTMSADRVRHRLITEDSPKHRAILANTILILVPSLNPDGVDIVADWYRKTLGTAVRGGRTAATLPALHRARQQSRLVHLLAAGDAESCIANLHNRWHPQIVYDVHQQGAYASRMFVPPWMDPIDPNMDPDYFATVQSLGTGMAADLTSAGKTGVAINAIYDFWTPSRQYQAYHGGARMLSESASAKLATPVR